MNFLLQPIDYPTYAFYSSSLCRTYFPRLIKNAFGLNLPLFLIGCFGILEAAVSYTGDLPLLEESIPFGKTVAFLLCLWVIPNSHLNLYRSILSGLEPILGIPPPSPRRITQNLKYLLGQSFYFCVSLILFTGGIFLSFSFSRLLLPLGFIYPELMLILTMNFIIIGGVIVFSFSFGLPCFLPASIAFSDKGRNFLVETSHLGLVNARQVILLFFLEGSVKMISYGFLVFIIFIIRGINISIDTGNVFDTTADLMVGSMFSKGIYFPLLMILFGVFNIFWDCFKAIFLSLIYIHENKLHPPSVH